MNPVYIAPTTLMDVPPLRPFPPKGAVALARETNRLVPVWRSYRKTSPLLVVLELSKSPELLKNVMNRPSGVIDSRAPPVADGIVVLPNL